MENKTLETALNDLVDGIRDITLGSVENDVIDGAAMSLIQSWNDHNKDNQIDTLAELINWQNHKANSSVKIGCCGGECACGK